MRRRAAVAGSWYPSSPKRLRAEVDGHLASADAAARSSPVPDTASLRALVVPHAGLVYSGPVAAHAYRLLRAHLFDLIVLVGPSHRLAFDGVSVWPRGAFATPLGDVPIDEAAAARMLEAGAPMHDLPAAHEQEHSLEMQLPFLACITPQTPILPLVMGHQTRDTVMALADRLVQALAPRRALLVASSDLSHYYDAAQARTLDACILDHVEQLDWPGLMGRLEQRPDHACGGGPMVAVLRAAAARGATASCVLQYADSGDVSGDKSAVVGYMAAALWGQA